MFGRLNVRAARKAVVDVLPWSLGGLGATYVMQRRSSLHGNSTLGNYFLVLWNGALPRPTLHYCDQPECEGRQLNHVHATEQCCTLHNTADIIGNFQSLLQRCSHKLHELLSNGGRLSSRLWPVGLDNHVEIAMDVHHFIF
jgi:hypothetical protein